MNIFLILFWISKKHGKEQQTKAAIGYNSFFSAGGTIGPSSGGSAKKEEVVAVKTEFKVKLVKIEGDTSVKLKVIKEIRALNPSLSLVEVIFSIF